jgi:hypothetical protein
MSDEKTQWGPAGNFTAGGLENKKKRMPLGTDGFLLQELHYYMTQLLAQFPEMGIIVLYIHISQKRTSHSSQKIESMTPTQICPL